MRERGFALVTVLWASMLLGAITSSVIATGRTEARLSRYRQVLTQLNALADGVVNIAIVRMLSLAAELQPPADASPFLVTFAGKRMSVTIQDEGGKVDLNYAPGVVLERLLTVAGLDANAAVAMADCIQDWRDPSPVRRANGAKAEQYRAAGLSYGPRNGPFQSIEELRLVLGMTQALFDRLAPNMTIYSQSPYVETDFATRDVLLLLPGNDAQRVSQLLAARAASVHPTVAIGHTVTIIAEAAGDDGARVRRVAVIRLTGNAAVPFQTFYWR